MNRCVCWRMTGLFILALLAWLRPGFLYAQTDAARGEPIAYVLFGGNSAKAPARQAINDFVAFALDIGPRLKKHGITRIYLQNPGGIWPGVDAADGREMRVDQWLLAEKARLPFADRDKLRTAFGLLRYYGVKEIICYLGSPTQLHDVERDLPECVKPFLDAGPRVSLGFDAMFHDGAGPNDKNAGVWREQWKPNSPYVRALIALRIQVHAQAGKVYSEPRLTKEHVDVGIGRLIDGTIANSSYDRHPGFAVNLAIQPGESIRITDTGNSAGKWEAELKEWPSGLTPALRSELNWGPLMPEPKEAN